MLYLYFIIPDTIIWFIICILTLLLVQPKLFMLLASVDWTKIMILFFRLLFGFLFLRLDFLLTLTKVAVFLHPIISYIYSKIEPTVLFAIKKMAIKNLLQRILLNFCVFLILKMQNCSMIYEVRLIYLEME